MDMRSATRRSLFVAITLIATAGLTDLARADRVQGFETGDPAVTSIGDAGKVGTFQGEAPPEGSSQYLLTTIGMMSNEDGLAPQSGSFAVGSGALNAFFNGVAVGGFEGSGVLIPFTVTAGQTLLTFQYDFLSNEPFQSMPRGDFAFAAIFDSSNALQSSTTLATAFDQSITPFDPAHQDPFQFHTGLQSLPLSVANLAPGNYMLGFGVADVGTADHASGLLIDNVQLVPEPSTIAFALAGAGLLVAVRRRIGRR
jgi:hypothetical protein